LKKAIKLKKKLTYNIKIRDIIIPSYMDYYTKVKISLNFFLGRSHPFYLFLKFNKESNSYNNNFIDSFYGVNKIFIYNKLKILNYKRLARKYRLKYRRYNKLNKIEGLSLFKSFLNNSIKYNGLFNRRKRIRNKRRIRMGRRNVSINFKKFFNFIFFYFLNQFVFLVDVYSRRNLNFLNLISVSDRKSKKYMRNNKNNLNIDKKIKKYKYFFIFKYKSKKIFKRLKKKKYGNTYGSIVLYQQQEDMKFFSFY
jgi:hypothetical protein